MGFDITLPATGLTRDGDLYQILRNNFIALYERFTTIEYFPNLPSGVTEDPTDPISYFKDYTGIVHLQGTGTSTNFININIPGGGGGLRQVTYLFTLPPGFRPDCETVTYTYTVPNRVYIWPLMGGNWGSLFISSAAGFEGKILSYTSARNAIFYLNGVSFFGV
jgi:hypothetical protein